MPEITQFPIRKIISQKLKQQENPPPAWLGLLCLGVGIFLFLVYFNVIASSEASFNYGRTPILFVAILFFSTGVYVVLYNKKIIKSDGVWPKIFGPIFYLSLLAIFQIVVCKEIFIKKNLEPKNIFLAGVTIFFDVLAVIMIIISFTKKQKNNQL